MSKSLQEVHGEPRGEVRQDPGTRQGQGLGVIPVHLPAHGERPSRQRPGLRGLEKRVQKAWNMDQTGLWYAKGTAQVYAKVGENTFS